MKSVIVLLTCTVSVLAAADPVRKDSPPQAKYLRDHAETRGFMLGRPTKAMPTPDGQAVLFLRSEPRVPKLALYEFDVATKKTEKLLTPEDVLKGAEETLSAEEKARRERQRISVGGFAGFQLNEAGTHILLQLSGRLYVVERSSRKVRELKNGPGTITDPKFAPDGTKIGYVKDYDVFVYDLLKDREMRITTGGTEKKSHGLAEFVAQEEMGRHTGWWWSPDSRFIAYEEADADGVEVWYVADPAKPGREPSPFFYPRPGKKNVSVRMGVIPISGGDTVWIDWDRKSYEYLALVRWDKHGPLTLGVQNRQQDRLLCLAVDVKTGKSERLVEHVAHENHWINLDQVLWRWLPGEKLFCRSPHNVTISSESANRLFSREHRLVETFQDLVHFDEQTGEIIFQASTNPTEAHLHRAHLKQANQATEPLTKARGVHSATGNSKLLCITSSTLSSMPRTLVTQRDGTEIGELPSVAEAPPFALNIELFPQPSANVVVDLSGLTGVIIPDDQYYGAIIRPRDFEPRKKYPVIVYTYGGPTHAVVSQSMRSGLLLQWLADQGFIVAALDNRGTPGRGVNWERSVYHKLGSVPLDGQVAGLQALGRKYPELDLERVGIYGWSFGGYLSALAVLQRPDIYKAAVAGAPVTDWEDYDTHYTERYLGLPQENARAYQEASLLTHAANLKRPLLLIHGTADDNVYFRHSLRLSDALFRHGKDFELLPLSGLTHMVPDPVVMENLYLRIARHFQKHLGQPSRPEGK